MYIIVTCKIKDILPSFVLHVACWRSWSWKCLDMTIYIYYIVQKITLSFIFSWISGAASSTEHDLIDLCDRDVVQRSDRSVGRRWRRVGGSGHLQGWEREREREREKRNQKRSIPVDPLPTKRIKYSCRSIASYPSLYISVFFFNVAR